jgi:hypothetical protein
LTAAMPPLSLAYWPLWRVEHLLAGAIAKLGGWVSTMGSGEPLGNKHLYARVKCIVNAADPIGLLSEGASDDEYHPEIDEIAFWLPKSGCRTIAQTNAMVHRQFVTWRGARTAGPRDAYREIATAIHALRSRRARSKLMKRLLPHAELMKHDQALRLAREVMSGHAETLRKLAE